MPETDYWANLFQEIYPQGIDGGVPPSFAFVSPGQLYRLVAGSYAEMSSSIELPISPGGLTLEAAHGLATKIAALPRELRGSTLGRLLGCTSSVDAKCIVTSSLSAAVILANDNASAVTPAVTLLSDLGIGIALSVAAAAGVFVVRRRRAEAALLYARGEHVAVFAGRSALEALLPTLAGGAMGFGLAYALTSVFAPAGSVSSGTAWSAVGHASVVVALALGLLVAAAAVSFLGLYDSGSRDLGQLRYVPWELVFAVGAVYLLLWVRSGVGSRLRARARARRHSRCSSTPCCSSRRSRVLLPAPHGWAFGGAPRARVVPVRRFTWRCVASRPHEVLSGCSWW